MERLLVLTFADQPLSEKNYLKKSCEKLGIGLEVLICSPWVQNVIKLKMLYEYVQKADPELILLVVDAYDVVLYDHQETIIEKFAKQEAHILFSAESNFMYKEPAKWLAFLRKYPAQPTIYQYLNSGTYMGKARHILQLLEAMQVQFEIDLMNEALLLPIKSDQYLLSRFYVENALQAGELRLKLDAYHTLLGVTGGRFCVLPLPGLSKWQSFVFFIIERNTLKLFSLHKHQKVPKDYIPDNERFFNKKTKTSPPVMHFPGTWDRFDRVYEALLTGERPSRKGSWWIAALISLVSYPLSIVAGPLFWLVTRKY